jgi:FkbM family methyltransferase
MRILRKNGFKGVLRAAILELENRNQNIALRILILLLHEVLFFIDELAISYPSDGGWKVVVFPNRSVRKLPALSTVADTHHGSSRHIEIMESLYNFDGFVNMNMDDIVVDVGAYVGSFSIYASPQAEQVISIDPLASIDNSLYYNVGGKDNVTIVPKAAWISEEEIEINRSYYPNENSILNPDRGHSQNSFIVTGDTIPNIVREAGYNKIDYLKVEAEGVEPEILSGALNDKMEIDRIAVDASVERGTEDSIADTVELLKSHGYEYRTKEDEEFWGEYIIFAKQ